MSITLREYIGRGNISSNPSNSPVHFRESDTSAIAAPSGDTLMVEVEGIHSYPFITRNFTRYMPDCLRESQKKWTSPYLKPLIKHHNDQNGEIIGRIYDAQYTEKTSVENAGGLIFTISVPDEKAAKEVENRILETVSIGVSANDVRCSICGKQITDAEEGCPDGHIRGNEYEGVPCCWDIHSMEPKELSYVIVPSDSYAKNKSIYRAKDAGKGKRIASNIHESLDDDKNKKNPQNGDKQKNMDLEKKLAEANEEIEKLKKQLADAEQVKAELENLKNIKAQKEEQDKKLAEIQALLDTNKEKLEKAEADLASEKEKLVISEEKVAAVTQEKEAAEASALEAKEQLRSIGGKVLNQYRKMSGKTEISEADMSKRSIDSIIDSVNDFVEDYGNKRIEVKEQEFTPPPPTPNPVPPPNDDPGKTPKNKDYSTVDLSLGLEEMFSRAANKNITL